MRFYKILLLIGFTTSIFGYQHQVPLEVARAHQKTRAPIKHRPAVYIHKQPMISHSAVPPRRARYTFYPGSLKANISHLASEFGWRNTVWLPSYDFHWVGKTRLSGNNIKGILCNLLHNYPLQAVFYEGNHVLVITTRNIS